MKTQQALHAVLRNDLSLFIRKAFATVSPGDEYLHNWHVDAIAHHLNLCMDGTIRRLIITMPPRHMKSLSGSVAFPAFVLGHDPSSRIVCVSYSDELAYKHSIDCRLLMESAWYERCFPGTVLSSSKKSQSEFATTKQGFRLATSVGGTLTGRGGKFLIIDDPQKADDGYSEAKRQQVINWYRQTANSRLDDPKSACIIVIQQRLHENDLAGMLLDSGGWTHLNLPAIAETAQSIAIGPGHYYARKTDEVLHSARMPRELLEQTRAEIGDMAFAGQYQQRPAPEGGGIVKLSWFPRFVGAIEKQFGDRIIQSWDLAWTTSDISNYSVCTTWLYRDYRMHLVHVLRKRLEVPDLREVIPAHADRLGAEQVALEQTGIGMGLLQQLWRDLDPLRRKYLGYSPKEDKAARLQKVAPLIAQGRVLFPESAPWLEAFQHELLSFPKGKYDDQVDSLSQALQWMWHQGGLPPPGKFAKTGAANTQITASPAPAGSRITSISRASRMSLDDLLATPFP